MYISRGFQRSSEGGESPSRPAPPHSVDYHLVHDRLTMLERLTALRAGGTLSEEEFLTEKERILALPAEELVLRPADPARSVQPHSPSLLAGLFNWKVLWLGTFLGVGLAFFTRAEETMQLLERLVG